MFDACWPSRKGRPSLNDVLHAGGPLTPLLFDVMCKFRSYNYAIVSDIEKAFLQTSLAEKHRDYTRLIWFKNVNKIDYENFANKEFIEPCFIRNNTITFLVKCNCEISCSQLPRYTARYCQNFIKLSLYLHL